MNKKSPKKYYFDIRLLNSVLRTSGKRLSGKYWRAEISDLSYEDYFKHICKLFKRPKCRTLKKDTYTKIFRELSIFKRISESDFCYVSNKYIAYQLEKKSAARTKSFFGKGADIVNIGAICSLPGSVFYKTSEWRSLRYKFLRENGNRCMACGKRPVDGVSIHVDHIKPRSYFPELSLDRKNLQILCEDCNLGKSNNFNDDWRV